MNTSEGLRKLLSQTAPINELLEYVQQHPVDLLMQIAREYQSTGQPVADHQVNLTHYMSDVALRALVQAGLIWQEAPGHRFIRAFVPTKKGLAYARNIQKKGTLAGTNDKAVGRRRDRQQPAVTVEELPRRVGRKKVRGND